MFDVFLACTCCSVLLVRLPSSTANSHLGLFQGASQQHSALAVKHNFQLEAHCNQQLFSLVTLAGLSACGSTEAGLPLVVGCGARRLTSCTPVAFIQHMVICCMSDIFHRKAVAKAFCSLVPGSSAAILLPRVCACWLFIHACNVQNRWHLAWQTF